MGLETLSRRLAPAVVTAAVLATAAGPARAEGDPGKGRELFEVCAACHSLKPDENTVGPTLHRVLGRPVASVEAFRYSPAMKRASGGVWTTALLDVFLADPQSVVRGTRMPFDGMKDPQARADLLAFVEQATK